MLQILRRGPLKCRGKENNYSRFVPFFFQNVFLTLVSSFL